jgi:hypothetical protein
MVAARARHGVASAQQVLDITAVQHSPAALMETLIQARKKAAFNQQARFCHAFDMQPSRSNAMLAPFP